MPATLQNKAMPQETEAKQTQCYHCGESCEQESLSYDKKQFCCMGCKTVYELLTVNNLESFYQLTDKPGLSLRGKNKHDYSWLEDKETIDKLADFRHGKQLKISFLLPQIHCTACIWLLENLYKLDPGVQNSQVNFLQQTVHISIDTDKLSLRALVEMLARIGYAPRLQLDQLNKPEKDQPIDRSLAYQIGVAGFAFGNIMLMSFPEYFGLKQLAFQQWFGYLNILFSLPVVFFSGQTYLQSAWQSLRQRKLNIDVPISLGVFTLLLRSIYEIVSQTGAGYLDSLAGLIFFLLIGKWFQQRTYHHLSFERDYKSYFPISVALKTGETFSSSTLDKLKAGDIVLIQNGGLLPADGLITAGEGNLDYSFVTGESDPIKKTIGDKVFAGGRQEGSNLEILLTKAVSQSYLTQLWNNEAFKKPQFNSSSSQLLEKVGRVFTPAILLIALLTLMYWWPKDTGIALQAFTAVLIIACPCAIALSVPFTLGNVIRLLGRKGVFVKNTSVLESIAAIDTLVFDKTGTLTSAHKNTEIQYAANDTLDHETKVSIKSITAHSSHPVSQQITALWPDVKTCDLQGFKEFPGKGIQATLKGQKLQLGTASFIGLADKKRGTWMRISDQTYGPFLIENNYRDGLAAMFKTWGGRYDFYLLSGDHDEAKALLSQFIPKKHLHFRQSPHDKLTFIQQKQAEGKQLMMIGDGLNDAGALKQSEVGMVVTENVNNFTPACDVILSSEQFAYLPQIIAYIKSSIRLVYLALAMAFIYNIIGLSFAVQGLLSPLIAAILMPLSSVTIALTGTLGSNWLFKHIFNPKTNTL